MLKTSMNAESLESIILKPRMHNLKKNIFPSKTIREFQSIRWDRSNAGRQADWQLLSDRII